MRNVEVFNGNQIGGCVTVITSHYNGETHRIMVDYGSALPGCDNEDFQYDWDENPIDAVFFTHYHGDHVGQILNIPPNVPIYMGDTARKVMLNLHDYLSRIPKEEEAKPHRQTFKLLNDDNRVKTFGWNGTTYDAIDIPGFHIEPYSVDHSAYDAYMFLIEAYEDDHKNGKQIILHTGDFRGHGRRGKAMLPLIKSYICKYGSRKVDTLVIEGTMMSRLSEKVKSEYEMQMEAMDYLKKHRHAFLICSSTNLDSLASFHKAWKQVNEDEDKKAYMYTYNYYYKRQLETFSETAGAMSSVYDFDNIEVLDLEKDLPSKKIGKTYKQKHLMEKYGFLALIKADAFCDKYLEEFIGCEDKPVIIFSMWDGYLNPKSKAFQKSWYDFIEKWKAKGVKFKQLHTSGHATAKMIEDVIKTVNPQEEIVPMHTENAKEFKRLNIGKELKERLRDTNEINKYEEKILAEMPDHRSISKELENAFLNGCLSGFREFIIEHNENCSIDERLLPLLRGVDDKIIVYRHNHKFWELSVIRNSRGEVLKGRVSFDFNHARFSTDWKENKLQVLKSEEFEFHDLSESKRANKNNYLKNTPEIRIVRNKYKDIIGGSIGMISSSQISFDKESFVAPLYEMVKNIFDDYFCHFELKEDHFRTQVRNEYGDKLKAQDRLDRSTNPEKRWQQRLSYKFSEIENGYYAYDLEFSQPFPHKDFVVSYADEIEDEDERSKYLAVNAKELKEKLTTNEPDILAIRYENTIPKAIVLMEVKSTSGACEDPSGIPSHLVGMYDYSNNHIFMQNRKKDAINCLKQYKKFGLLPDEMVLPDNVDDLSVERVLILTNAAVSNGEVSSSKKEIGAIEYFENEIYDSTMTLAEEYDCKIIKIQGNYFDDDISIIQVK